MIYFRETTSIKEVGVSNVMADNAEMADSIFTGITNDTITNRTNAALDNAKVVEMSDTHKVFINNTNLTFLYKFSIKV